MLSSYCSHCGIACNCFITHLYNLLLENPRNFRYINTTTNKMYYLDIIFTWEKVYCWILFFLVQPLEDPMFRLVRGCYTDQREYSYSMFFLFRSSQCKCRAHRPISRSLDETVLLMYEPPLLRHREHDWTELLKRRTVYSAVVARTSSSMSL